MAHHKLEHGLVFLARAACQIEGKGGGKAIKAAGRRPGRECRSASTLSVHLSALSVAVYL